MPVVDVQHLTKEYQLGAMQGVRQMLRNAAARVTGRDVPRPSPFRALDDVSFRVEAGEVVGIIGHNGAGKSTLLKMLARISTPTRGSCVVHGRIAPLIEVGAGFVGDFTGRENVYLNGAILGLKKQEIDRKFDEIVEFAEMAEFIDTPVKRYSSGMQVKLAFAVATSIESEVLIVDEVLAVGDLAFQRKCFDRMEDLIKRQGRTVLVVSHNIRQVERMCNRVIVMDHGRVAFDGAARDACNFFYAQSDRRITDNVAHSKLAKQQLSSSGELELSEVTLLDEDGVITKTVKHGHDCTVVLTYQVHKMMTDVSFGVGVHTTDMVYLADRDTADDQYPIRTLMPGPVTVRCRIKKFPFLPGTYSLRLGVAADTGYRLAYLEESVSPFQVVSAETKRLQGFVPLELEWDVNTASCVLQSFESQSA